MSKTIPIDALTDIEASAELKQLAAAIRAHNQHYHSQDAPVISDAEFDALMRRNEAIEAAFPHLIRDDSPSKQVGAPAASHFAKRQHSVPMLSLNNAFDDEEMREFDPPRETLSQPARSCAPRLFGRA